MWVFCVADGDSIHTWTVQMTYVRTFLTTTSYANGWV